MEILKCIIFKLKFICAKTMHFAIRIHLKCHFRCSFFEISFTGTWSDFVNKNNDSTNDLSLRDMYMILICKFTLHVWKEKSCENVQFLNIIQNKIQHFWCHIIKLSQIKYIRKLCIHSSEFDNLLINFFFG